MLYYFAVKEFLEKIIFEILKDAENKIDFIPWKTINKKNNMTFHLELSKSKYLN